MRFGVLGTGTVGQTLGAKLTRLGHEVRLGAREAGNARAAEWVARTGPPASAGTFEDAASFGEILVNCTAGVASLEALAQAGAANIAGKILIDVANPLDFARGFPPLLSVSNDDSLGEAIQRAYPTARVVKTLNTVNAQVMVDPGRLAEETDIFLSGDDPDAKAQVATLLREGFGWRRIVDLGGIATARGVEMWLPLWVRLWSTVGSGDFNFRIVGPRPA